MPLPGNISTEVFLSNYWQKQPCLIRNAFNNFQPILDRENLFQLAGQDNIESRLVIEKDGEYPWQVLHGPLDDLDSNALPESHWTLLVQGVNYHVMAAAELIRKFNFIPNWRVDDLMVSYAVPGGSVGPHLDSYDVFLLQATGSRTWQINTNPHDTNDFVPDLDLRIIGDFKATQSWQLDPGDMLYLPPGVAHHGIAVDECMTYSIGFHAPDSKELLSYFAEDYQTTARHDLYTDAKLQAQQHPREITEHTIDTLHDLLQSSLNDQEDVKCWLGKYLTRLPDVYFNDNDENNTDDAETLFKIVKDKQEVQLSAACRTAFIKNETDYFLFLNGSQFTLPPSCLELLYDMTERAVIRDKIVQKINKQDLLELFTFLTGNGLIHKK
jgi:50S ribosomal protein L16 3-hydroxylase